MAGAIDLTAVRRVSTVLAGGEKNLEIPRMIDATLYRSRLLTVTRTENRMYIGRRVWSIWFPHG